MRQPSQILQRKRNALQKVSFSLVKAAETVGAEGLHDANINVRVVMVEKFVALHSCVTVQRVEIVLKKMLAQLGRQISLGVEERGRNVILQSAFASGLVIHEIWISAAQHHIAGLKIAIQKIIAIGAEQEVGQFAKIILQGRLTERNPSET